MKNTGFSLVELLVVIAIMAILAGVAVPVYSHYTTEAKVKVDENYLAEVFHAAEIEAAMAGAQVESISFATGELVIDLGSENADEEMVEKVLSVAGTHEFQSNVAKTWPAPTPATTEAP